MLERAKHTTTPPGPPTMTKAVVLANGYPPSRDTVQRLLSGATLLVCADGGANVARRYGLMPDAIVGDFDSVTAETLAHYRDVTQVRDQDTERTDAEKSIDWALGRKAVQEIVLLGASAGRLDHVIGHVALLKRYRGRTRLVLEDDAARAWLGSGTIAIDEPEGTIVSFFAVGGAATGVTTENFRYALVDRTLELGVQDSVSNVVAARPARVKVAGGDLLMVVVRTP